MMVKSSISATEAKKAKRSVKWFFYNVLFAVGYAAMMPFFLARMRRRGGYRARMGDRFGRYPAEIEARLKALHANGKKPVWIHAVSVGEVQVAGQLMRAMREIEPGIRFVFSTTSSTGWKIAEREVTDADVLVYNPVDFPSCVNRAFAAIDPRAVILTETEIWPNFIRRVRRAGVPLYLVNARISDHSAPRYRQLKWFFGDCFRAFAKIWAQSDLDRRRILDAGGEAGTIDVSGSVKFDVARRNEAKERELRAWVGEGDVLLGGSTWPGEDELMLRAYRRALDADPALKLVIAPRHFEKADAVEANVLAAGFACRRRSCGADAPAKRPANAAADARDVFLADTTGELMGLFGIASVAFVGKTVTAHGSQNMIEPCLCGVATVVGPNTENFRPVMSDLLASFAIDQRPDAASVEDALVEYMRNPGARMALGAKAVQAVTRRRGATARIAREIVEALGPA